MDVVAEAGAARRIGVQTEDVDGLAPSRGLLQNQRDQVAFTLNSPKRAFGSVPAALK